MTTSSAKRACQAKDPSNCAYHNPKPVIAETAQTTDLFEKAMARNTKIAEMEKVVRWNQELYKLLAEKRPTKIHTHMKGLTNYSEEDNKQIEDYNSSYKKLEETLTKEQLAALHEYTGLGSDSVNSFLRNKDEFMKETKPQFLEKRLTRAKELIKTLDSVFASSIRKDRTVYRFLTPDATKKMTSSEDFAKKMGLVTGEEVAFDTYLSTTIDPHLIARNSEEDRDENTTVVFIMKSNKGIPVGYTASSQEGHNFTQASEREILLPRGMRFKVTEVTRTVGYENGNFGVNTREVNPLTVYLEEI